jgi:hypothetical protein
MSSRLTSIIAREGEYSHHRGESRLYCVPNFSIILPKIVKLAALINDGLIIVVTICIKNGSSNVGFSELHNLPDQPITSPRHPIIIVGIIHHTCHLIAWTTCSIPDTPKSTTKVMQIHSVGTYPYALRTGSPGVLVVLEDIA